MPKHEKGHQKADARLFELKWGIIGSVRLPQRIQNRDIGKIVSEIHPNKSQNLPEVKDDQPDSQNLIKTTASALSVQGDWDNTPPRKQAMQQKIR